MTQHSEGDLPDFGHFVDHSASEFGDARHLGSHPSAGHFGSQFPSRFLGSGLPLGNGLPGGMSVAQLQHTLLQQQMQTRALGGLGLHSALPFVPIPRSSQPLLGAAPEAFKDPHAEQSGREGSHYNAHSSWLTPSQQQQHHQPASHALSEPGSGFDGGPLTLSQLLRHQQSLGLLQQQHPQQMADATSPADQTPAAISQPSFPQLPAAHFQLPSQTADAGSGSMSGGSPLPGSRAARLASSDLTDSGRTKLQLGSRSKGDGAGADVTKAKNKLAQRRFRERQRVRDIHKLQFWCIE